MGEDLATTAPGREDDASSSHSVSAREPSASGTSPPRPPSPSRALLVDEATTNADSASAADELTLTNDLISSSYIAPASNPHGSNTHEPILVSDGRDIRTAFLTVAEQSLPPSVRMAQRLQRQLNAQLRMTRSQLESISAKVEDMITSEDQCKVASSSGPSASTSRGPVEVDDLQAIAGSRDEGFFDGGEDGEEMAVERLRLTFRKAGDHRGIRKNVGGTEILFARPRMRKKIVRRRRADERQGDRSAV